MFVTIESRVSSLRNIFSSILIIDILTKSYYSNLSQCYKDGRSEGNFSKYFFSNKPKPVTGK